MGHRPPGPPPPWAVSSRLLAEAGIQRAQVCPLSPSPTLLLPRAWSWPMDLQPEILEQRTGVRSWRPLLAPRAPWAPWPEHEWCPAWSATPACLFPPRHLDTHGLRALLPCHLPPPCGSPHPAPAPGSPCLAHLLPLGDAGGCREHRDDGAQAPRGVHRERPAWLDSAAAPPPEEMPVTIWAALSAHLLPRNRCPFPGDPQRGGCQTARRTCQAP